MVRAPEPKPVPKRDLAAERAAQQKAQEARQKDEARRAAAADAARRQREANAAAAQQSGAELGSWRQAVSSRLARAQRYPDSARARGAQGVATVSFTLTASGGVASASIARSSGQADLDAEALAMVHRAAPYPTPPANAPRTFTAPVSFRLR